MTLNERFNTCTYYHPLFLAQPPCSYGIISHIKNGPDYVTDFVTNSKAVLARWIRRYKSNGWDNVYEIKPRGIVID